MSISKKVAFILGAVLFAAISASPANNAEEVIFSKTGGFMSLSGNSIAAGTPFGFWIWCAGQAAPGSKGGYQNANACQGSMYFYGLDKHASGVIGEMSEGPDGIYTMHVVQGTAAQLFSGSLDPAFACDLTNTTPDPKGPGNGVNVSCTFFDIGGGNGNSSVTDAVVNVTGPN
jgi:hypothetical protein